ncbi:MAG: hypothetical protein K2N49_01410 [Ruminococcus sp.]|nr:hypothetical protein [Ruminococcus sp.]MDE7225509.1 hypothetical protein [Ruminococcus sp.]
MKKISAVLCASLAVGTMFCLTGCGNKKTDVDVTSGLALKFYGYDGYGTASLPSDYQWMSDMFASAPKSSKPKSVPNRSVLESAVKYKIEPDEGLKNGDTVTVTAEINESMIADYDFRLVGEPQTYTVTGLDELEEFDPFEGIDVVFEGIAPNAYASVKNTPTNMSLKYVFDRAGGLSVGDTITLSVETYGDSNLEQYCLGFGKVPTASSKTYTVENVASYVSKLEDIPEDALAKMDSQAQDVLNARIASTWEEECKLRNSQLIGYYFLTPKDSNGGNTHNYLYLVYKNDMYIGKNSHDVTVGDVSYYYYTGFYDIMIMEDGTCSVSLSDYVRPITECRFEYEYDGFIGKSTGYYYVNGYKDLDSLFSDCVTKVIDKYTYVSTVEDIIEEKPEETPEEEPTEEIPEEDKSDKSDESGTSESESEQTTEEETTEPVTEEETKSE